MDKNYAADLLAKVINVAEVIGKLIEISAGNRENMMRGN